MKNDNAVAVALVAGDGVIDKLELETGIPLGDRTFLASYQAKLGAAPTRIDEDMLLISIFKNWALNIQKQ